MLILIKKYINYIYLLNIKSKYNNIFGELNLFINIK